LQAQKQRLTGERGQKRIHRPELEEMYGFDTKCAMHMLRLGFQGVELLTTGRLSCRLAIRRELAVLGVTESVAYPDLDGLARDLRDRFLA